MSIHNKHSGLDLDKKGRVLPAECSLQKKKKITCIIYNIYIYINNTKHPSLENKT